MHEKSGIHEEHITCHTMTPNCIPGNLNRESTAVVPTSILPILASRYDTHACTTHAPETFAPEERVSSMQGMSRP